MNDIQLMTPEQAVNFAINTYPVLYASVNREIARFKIDDHIFNVIGNGIRDTEEFIDHFSVQNRDKSLMEDPPQKYLSDVTLYRGYTEMEIFGNDEHTIEFPKIETMLDGLFTEEEKANHPEVILWRACNKCDSFNPYPNFKKEYSTVWQVDSSVLTPEWIEEAIWFYTECSKYFDRNNLSDYHNAVPSDPKKLEKRIRDYEMNFRRYFDNSETEEEAHQKITEAYGLEFKGDLLAFIQVRWEMEFKRIRAFIRETLDYLTTLKG